MIKKFSITFSSRGRPKLLKGLLDSIVEQTYDLSTIEARISCDLDDETMWSFPVENYSFLHMEFIEREINLHKRMNRLVRESSGKYLFSPNDDCIILTKHWDKVILDTFEEYLKDKPDGIVLGQTQDDSIDKMGNYASFPILPRKIIDILGFFVLEEFPTHGIDVLLHRIYESVGRICPIENMLITHLMHNNSGHDLDVTAHEMRQVTFKNRMDYLQFDISEYTNRLNEYISNFNTCGILPGDRSDLYISNIRSILNQTLDSNIKLHIVISDCMSNINVRNKLIDTFKDTISYNFVDELVPMEPSFNHTTLKCVKQFGNFDGYLYVESGIKLFEEDTIQKLCKYLQINKYAMISTIPDTDIGFHYEDTPDLSIDYVVPVGKGINLHCQMFSGEYFSFYNRLLPDIFAGHCMESVLSFCCAAIQKQWIIVADAKVKHDVYVDGQSIGFRPDKYVRETGKPSWDHPYKLSSLMPIFSNPKALKLGLGYEETRSIVMHDHSQYDENYHCINDQLKYYIKDNLFLNNTLLDYDNIQHEFIQGTFK